MRVLALLFLAFALASAPVHAQASGEMPSARGVMGIGFVVADTAGNPTIPFYETPEARQPVHQIPKEAYSGEAPLWLQPEAWWPDYGLFQFRAVESREGWARVVVHQENERLLWMRTSDALPLMEWDAFLTERVTIVQREDIAANPIRTAPEATAPLANVPPEAVRADWGGDCLLPVEVQGEWARVSLSGLCSGPDETPPLGWVRWRDGDRLLITWGLTC